MTEALLIVCVLLLLAALGLLVLLWRRPAGAVDFAPVLARVEGVERLLAQVEKGLRDEAARGRAEAAEQSRGLREEVQRALKLATDSLVQSVDRISQAQQVRLEDFAKRLEALKESNDGAGAKLRMELAQHLGAFKESQEKRLNENAALVEQKFESFGRKLGEFTERSSEEARVARTELAQQLTALGERNEKKSEELRTTVEGRLKELQTENGNKLEEMRKTVDEKLQGTVEKRFTESFKLVSDRLEQVHKGLGEMQSLASGVGDLRRVLTNVKTRGTWGEMQLGNLLEQILAPDQFARNVRTNPASSENVEFAIKLPGRDEGAKAVWLPIDAKFPKEDYERLVDAAERGDAEAVEAAGKQLEARVRAQARDIRDKYVAPPHSTDFGLMYLPTEGLYAEVLRRPGLADAIQRESRVVIVGPTTLAALLNSLQMGFRTLAIQQRSSEVWKVLGAVKADFGKFSDLLEKVKRKIDETGNTIEDAAQRSRQIEKKLRKVEELPAAEAAALLRDVGAPAGGDEEFALTGK